MTPLFYEDSLGAKVAEAFDGLPSADDELVDDPNVLDAAQAAVNGQDPQAVYQRVGSDWVAVFGPSKLSGILDAAGWTASMVTMPLDSEGIEYAWDPYPPGDMSGAASPTDHVADRPFTLLVPPADAQLASSLITASPGASTNVGGPATYERTGDISKRTNTLALILVSLLVAICLVPFAIDSLIALAHYFR